MADRFSNDEIQIDSSAVDAFAVTPGTSDLPQVTRAVYVGTGGDLVVNMLTYDGTSTEITFKNVQDGSILPLRVTKILSATTATDIIGLF